MLLSPQHDGFGDLKLKFKIMSPKTVDHTFGAPQDALKDQGYFDSGYSRHMTGNISYLMDFKEHDGGYVAFGGGAKGCKITGKGTIRTGIKREFSVARTPQQNGVAERRNRTLIETARTMLADSKLPTTFWAKAVNTACYVQNKTSWESLMENQMNGSLLATLQLVKLLEYTILGLESTKTVNTAEPVNTAAPTNTDYPNDPLMPDLEDARIFDDAYDTRDAGAEADYNNLETVISVSPIPFTRIHKDHLKRTYHWRMKRIFRYLNGQPTLGLWYPKDSPLELIAYSDSDYAGVSLDRKSTTGGYQFLGLELRKYLINDGHANLVQHAGDYFNTAGVFLLGFYQHNKCLVQYALTVNPTIYTSFIKQFWTSAKVKTVNDEVRIQALVDGKRVNIKESSIRRILRLEDAEGTSCLTNADIFKGLTRMRYEKPSDKLTFYKAFFSPQWKFLIHTILQCLSAKTTSWNEFSSTMAPAIICLATNQKFNFLRYILLSLVKNIEAGVPFFMVPGFVKLIINHQLRDMTHHKDIFAIPSFKKKVFANMKRVGTRFSGVATLLFDNMLVQAPEEVDEHNVPLPSPSHDPLPSGADSLKLKELIDFCTNLSNKVLNLESEVIDIKSTYQARIEKLESNSSRFSEGDRESHRVERLEEENKGRKITDINADVEINLEKAQAEACNFDLDHQEKVLSILDVNDEEPADVEKVIEVVKAAKLITEVVTTTGVDVNVASIQDTSITTVEATKVSVPRKKRGVIIQDPEETTPAVTVQPKLDEEVARQLEVELNADINWNTVIEQVKKSERLTDAVMKYQALKRKPLTEAQARRNMIHYLKSMAGYKMDYFKGMSYDEIRPLFEKHYNYNKAFLNEVNEGINVPEQEVRQEKEVEVESSKRKGESLEQEIEKKQNTEQETEELKKHLHIVPHVDDDVYINATPLASKIPIVDYKIHTERNRPYFKIIRADGNHMLFLSFSTMLKNFVKEDLESL
nr:ribonuclease H-like domain-containing protein [Tanacetum cinerariifolium]